MLLEFPSPYDQDGQFNEPKHRQNMEAALQQYIARVDGTPCMGTSISLHRGVDSHDFLERRKRLLVFLKGSGRDKAELKKRDAQEYKHFEKVWEVRQNHMDKTLPSNYAFLLRCCGKRTCPHSLCAAQNNGDDTVDQPADSGVAKDLFCICRQPEGNFMICCDHCGQWFHGDCIGITEEDGERMDCFICQNCKQPDNSPEDAFIPAWYPGGPSFIFFPYPVIDSTRPWGSECASCGSCCSGHYVTDVDQLLALRENSKAMRALPPSTIIEESFKKGSSDIVALAKKCCLTTDEVTTWFHHLQKKKATRKKAVQKAKETREKKKRC